MHEAQRRFEEAARLVRVSGLGWLALGALVAGAGVLELLGRELTSRDVGPALLLAAGLALMSAGGPGRRAVALELQRLKQAIRQEGIGTEGTLEASRIVLRDGAGAARAVLALAAEQPHLTLFDPTGRGLAELRITGEGLPELALATPAGDLGASIGAMADGGCVRLTALGRQFFALVTAQGDGAAVRLIDGEKRSRALLVASSVGSALLLDSPDHQHEAGVTVDKTGPQWVAPRSAAGPTSSSGYL